MNVRLGSHGQHSKGHLVQVTPQPIQLARGMAPRAIQGVNEPPDETRHGQMSQTCSEGLMGHYLCREEGRRRATAKKESVHQLLKGLRSLGRSEGCKLYVSHGPNYRAHRSRATRKARRTSNWIPKTKMMMRKPKKHTPPRGARARATASAGGAQSTRKPTHFRSATTRRRTEEHTFSSRSCVGDGSHNGGLNPHT